MKKWILVEIEEGALWIASFALGAAGVYYHNYWLILGGVVVFFILSMNIKKEVEGKYGSN